MVDVYRNEVRPQREYWKLLLYSSLFHQCIAGPIVRYETVADQIDNRKITANDIYMGLRRFSVGLAKKAILANSCASIADTLLPAGVASLKAQTTLEMWLGMIAYMLQIYLDFSAYSDMAIGMGRMVGFHYDENFNYPYMATSVNNFWRRWHISLSSFFRDYVYIPLGGNRCSTAKYIRNMAIVWFLTGMWHGASWNFIFWGLFYGVLLFIEKTLFKKKLQKIPAPFCYIYTMFFVILGWALFYFTDLTALWTFIKSAFGVGTALYDLTAVSTFCTNAWLIAVCVIASTPIPTIIHKNFCKKSKVFAAISEPVLVIVGLGVCFVLLVGQTYNPFLYFRF